VDERSWAWSAAFMDEHGQLLSAGSVQLLLLLQLLAVAATAAHSLKAGARHSQPHTHTEWWVLSRHRYPECRAPPVLPLPKPVVAVMFAARGSAGWKPVA
jgi:hypothetical protein